MKRNKVRLSTFRALFTDVRTLKSRKKDLLHFIMNAEMPAAQKYIKKPFVVFFSPPGHTISSGNKSPHLTFPHAWRNRIFPTSFGRKKRKNFFSASGDVPLCRDLTQGINHGGWGGHRGGVGWGVCAEMRFHHFGEDPCRTMAYIPLCWYNSGLWWAYILQGVHCHVRKSLCGHT